MNPEEEYLGRGDDEDNSAAIVPVSERLLIARFPRNEAEARNLSAFLERSHKKCYKIISCMSETERMELRCDDLITPACGFLDSPGCVEHYPMAPNTPGAIKQLLRFCISEDTFLSMKQSNVLCILCRTGKGRASMMAACMLLHQGVCMSAGEAITAVCDASSATAINFPSQIRYIHYYERLLRSPAGEHSQTLRLNSVRVTTIPCFDASILNQGCTPHVAVSLLAQVAELTVLESTAPFRSHVVFDQQQRWAELEQRGRFYSKTAGEQEIEMDLTAEDVLVRGDVVLCLLSGEHKMLQVAFHTAFVADNYLRFDRSTCDLAHRDVADLFDDGLVVELFFSRVSDVPELNIGDFTTEHREADEALIACLEDDSVD